MLCEGCVPGSTAEVAGEPPPTDIQDETYISVREAFGEPPPTDIQDESSISVREAFLY